MTSSLINESKSKPDSAGKNKIGRNGGKGKGIFPRYIQTFRHGIFEFKTHKWPNCDQYCSILVTLSLIFSDVYHFEMFSGSKAMTQ